MRTETSEWDDEEPIKHGKKCVCDKCSDYENNVFDKEGDR